MLSFKLNYTDFKNQNSDLSVLKITSLNINDYLSVINETIQFFHSEIEWEMMYDYDEAIYRIKNGMNFYIFIDNSEILGHVWFRDYLDGRLLFNLFVRNKNIVKKYSGKELVSNVIQKHENNVLIYCEVDEWNIKSINLFKRLGFNLL
jgi:RimJ/RimL family protein N-acetyltransferase